MEVYRQFPDIQGESQIEVVSQEILKKMTAWSHAKAWRLNIHPPGAFLDWHPAGGEFIIVVLYGKIGIGYTNGEKNFAHLAQCA